MSKNTEVENKGTKPKKNKKAYLRDFVNITYAMKRMLGYTFKVSPIQIVGLLITTAFTSMSPFISAWINGRVIDELVSLITVQNGINQAVINLGIILFIFFIVSGVLNTIRGYFSVNLYFNISREFGHEVTKKLANLDIEYYENSDTMDLVRKVRENYGHRPSEFVHLTTGIISALVGVITGLAIFIAFSPILIVLLLILSLPKMINDIVFGKRVWGIWGAKADVKKDYWNTLDNLINDKRLMEIRIFRARQFMLDRVYNMFSDFQKEQIKNERNKTLVNISLDILSAIGFGIVLIIIVLAVIAKRITIGQFSFYYGTARNLQHSFSDLFSRISSIYENGLYVVDIFTVLDLQEKIKMPPKAVVLEDDAKTPIIEFKNVGFVYPGTEVHVLKNFNLKINPGRNIAIVGENGAGKTTLVKLLMRFYDVTEGEILIDGINIKDLDLDSWYKKVGTLFQTFNHYHFDVKTNIRIGDTNKELNEENMENVIQAAKLSGADKFIQEYKNKYDQVLSRSFKEGIDPSIGQWQKIALARAFFKDAPVLILDEPTSAIDPKAEFEIFEKLFEFAHEKSVIIISHRFSTVRNAQEIVVVDKGEIVEQGTHEELVKIENGMYKVAFELQKKGYE